MAHAIQALLGGICDPTKGRSVSVTLLIEDYALIGNNATAALVGRNAVFTSNDSPQTFDLMLGAFPAASSGWEGRNTEKTVQLLPGKVLLFMPTAYLEQKSRRSCVPVFAIQ